MRKTITVIANPASRSGRGKRLWPLWKNALEQAKRPFSFLETASFADCADKAEHAAMSGGIVAAAGGDGTVNAAVNGVMRLHSTPRGPGAACGEYSLGVLYSGTSPDFCRFHGLPLEAAEAVNALLAGRTRSIDVAALSCTPEQGVFPRHFFASSCNIGLGAATARFANAWRRFFGDGPGTCLGLALAMLSHKPFACRLDADGDVSAFEDANHIILLKNPHIASGIRVDLPVTPCDGRMYAIVIHGHSRMGLLRLVRLLYSGGWAGLPGVFIRRCRTAEVTASPAQEAECDGDPCGVTPVSATLLPKALRLVVPAPQGDAHA